MLVVVHFPSEDGRFAIYPDPLDEMFFLLCDDLLGSPSVFKDDKSKSARDVGFVFVDNSTSFKLAELPEVLGQIF